MIQFRVKTVGDFVALAPQVIGFTPENSLVMLSITNFSARVDMPNRHQVLEVCEYLIAPVKRANVESVVLLFYGDTDDVVVSGVISAFMEADLKLMTVLCVKGNQWREVGDDEWQTIDVATHPITLDAMLINRNTFATREDMVDYARPHGLGWTAEQREMVKQADDEATVQRLMHVSQATAGRQVMQWLDILRGADEATPVLSDIALVTAWLAYRSGNGAMAMVVLEYVRPESSVRSLLENIIMSGVDPRR